MIALSRATGSRARRSSPAIPRRLIRGVSIDSRSVQDGDLFAALPGERVDGHDYLEAAVERGAVAVLCEPARAPALGRVGRARGARRARGAAGADASGAPAERCRAIVGVAGSAGKTSTKDALRALLAPHRRVVAAHRNHNNELGRAADARPHRAGHRGLHLRARDARPRPDRRARRDRRADARRSSPASGPSTSSSSARSSPSPRRRPSCSRRCRRAPSRSSPTTSRCSSRYLRADLDVRRFGVERARRRAGAALRARCADGADDRARRARRARRASAATCARRTTA